MLDSVGSLLKNLTATGMSQEAAFVDHNSFTPISMPDLQQEHEPQPCSSVTWQGRDLKHWAMCSRGNSKVLSKTRYFGVQLKKFILNVLDVRDLKNVLSKCFHGGSDLILQRLHQGVSLCLPPDRSLVVERKSSKVKVVVLITLINCRSRPFP